MILGPPCRRRKDHLSDRRAEGNEIRCYRDKTLTDTIRGLWRRQLFRRSEGWPATGRRTKGFERFNVTAPGASEAIWHNLKPRRGIFLGNTRIIRQGCYP
jgi:hypothetical protein